ncbi:L,D-transpeptidase family protein [Stutzerimonas stutzeri]|uniref:L,D-transpeptidase family protein n=1 Tax=Stutzerimonas sp. S1 TaxID=3030652 RepID=UPI002225B6AF|nr:L,D-transpeptidase family protein [Stutzerimonas sp. S1]MCW3149299.1 L,D-transpeptidase family protein [Stutzerimonas sp. S1]
MFKKYAFRLAAGLLWLPLSALAAPATEPVAPLRAALEQLPAHCSGFIPRITPAAQERLFAFYQTQDFETVWRSYRQIDSLLQQLEQLADDGLAPANYHVERIRQLTQSATAHAQHRTCSDLLTSHAYLTALHDLARGRLPRDEIEPLWRNPELPVRDDRQQLLAIAVAGLADLPDAFAQARPDLQHYLDLRAAYARLRRSPLPQWLAIPGGQTLRPQMRDRRVPLLRARLLGRAAAASGDTSEAERFDPALVAAVEAFQRQHGLEPDGVVGRATLAALNVSPAARLDQLRINLERLRWIAHDLEPRSLLVDIAGARLIYFEECQVQWQTRTQVGREARRTPPLKSTISRLTLNPTWTVPPTILREDKLPLIRKDPGYLERSRLRVLDAQGNRLDPHSVDWSSPHGIFLRQDAGPENPLGRVAIRFANPFSVYLHDTPSQQLFAKATRTTSSGCVRVEGALQVVDLLLTDAERAEVAGLLETGKTHEFRLARPMPILMAYWTADTDETGQPLYRPDIYQQDAALLAALNQALAR